jgi:hypothetical protein
VILEILSPSTAKSVGIPASCGLNSGRSKSAAYKSIGTSDTKPRIFKRGGARKRKGRITNTLTAKQCADMVNAVFAARDLGLPLNRFVTIHWERARCRPKQAAQATQAFLRYARHWLYAQGLPFAYMWVRENDFGDGAKGDHVHILLHLPNGKTLGRLQRRWLKSITGKPYEKGAILTRVIAGHSQAATAAPAHYWVNVCALAEYALKGGTKRDLDASGLGSRWGEGGRVVGQRVGISRNLSRTVPRHPIA